MRSMSASAQIQDKLKKALQLHQAGDLKKAQRLYQDVLKKAPTSSDANHLLGVCFRQLGFPKRGVEYIRKAITLAPGRGVYHANLARCLYDIETHPREAVLTEADRALALDASLIEALNLKSVLLMDLSRPDEAEALLTHLTQALPDNVKAWRNLGQLCFIDHRYEDAAIAYGKAITLDPKDRDSWINRAKSLFRIQQYNVSLTELKTALQQFPDDPDLSYELALVLSSTGEFLESYRYLRPALEAAPTDPDRQVTLSVTLNGLGRFDEALKVIEQVYANTDDPSSKIRWALSLAYQAVGRLEEAWAHAEARAEAVGFKLSTSPYDLPHEDVKVLSALSGKKILLWHDQGIGDFLRCLSMLDECAGHVQEIVLDVPDKLTDLVRRSFPQCVIAADLNAEAINALDGQICLSDLVTSLRPSIASFQQGKMPSVIADIDRIAALKARIPDYTTKPVVGVAWRSQNLEVKRARNYLDITQISPIFDTPDITFVNLQYSALQKELDWVNQHDQTQLLAFDDIDLFDDLDAAAALTACMDLVLSSNTSVADLAGALDIPCWRFGAINGVSLLGQANPPWYRSTTYYRIQPEQRAVDLVPKLVDDLAFWKRSVRRFG